MSKYLEVQKKNDNGQDSVSDWIIKCKTEGKPSVIIYYEGDNGYIAANITHLLSDPEKEMSIDQVSVDEQFSNIAVSVTSNNRNYYNHNNLYFTIDGVPKEVAPAFASKIFDILKVSLVTRKKGEIC
jgi:hypothetical protein